MCQINICLSKIDENSGVSVKHKYRSRVVSSDADAVEQCNTSVTEMVKNLIIAGLAGKQHEDETWVWSSKPTEGQASPSDCHKTAKIRCYEHSEQARAPHTNGPRDVPRCGALSLIKRL